MKVWQAIVGVVGLVTVAALATQVGGIAIRRASDGSALEISEPVVLGVATQATWSAQAGLANNPVALYVRSLAGEEPVGQASYGDGRATVTFPCALVGEVSLILRNEKTQQQLGVLQQVEYLPPGPDCLQ